MPYQAKPQANKAQNMRFPKPIPRGLKPLKDAVKESRYLKNACFHYTMTCYDDLESANSTQHKKFHLILKQTQHNFIDFFTRAILLIFRL